MPNSSGGLELIDFLVDAVATLLRIAKAQNEQLQQLGAVAAEEESLHDIECACSALFPAYAGVIPNTQNKGQMHNTFPRIRGGDPSIIPLSIWSEHFSPHTRG